MEGTILLENIRYWIKKVTLKTTIKEMRTKKLFDLIEPKKKKKKGAKYVNSGQIQILKMEEFKVHTFFDYITGGTQISLIVGIDFTGSNGYISIKIQPHI